MKVAFTRVNKNFGIINVLRDLDFVVNSGEFIFLTGPSGSGKSTILKLILRQIIPSGGSIFIDDTDLLAATADQLNHIRRRIGVIYQDYQLITDKTVEENIAVALDIINFPPALIAAKIDAVIEEVGLKSRRHQFPAQLSGGELQRASLARALAVEPKLILADEPTGNLDPENSWNLINLFQSINQKTGCTIIMTTHNLDITRTLGKRIIRLQDGQILNELEVNPVTSENPPVIIKKKKKKIKKNL